MNTKSMAAIVAGMALGLVLSQATFPLAVHSQDKKANPPAAKDSSVEQLQGASAEFEKAFNAGKAKSIADQFLDNAEVVDEDGNLVQGRADIEARFAELFKGNPQARIAVEVVSLRQLSQDVAVEDGFSTTTLQPGEPPSRSPYTVVYLKRDGQWRIASVRDFPEESTVTPHAKLLDVAWLIGDWVDESRDGRVETHCRWSEDGNYLLQDYIIKPRRGGELRGTQRIGYDPLHKSIRAWAFDHSGAFSESVWTPVDGAWIIKAHGVTPGGEAASATRVITLLSKDGFQIDSTSQTVGNELLPDSSVRVVRRPPAPTKS